jgi:hypothetical protein
MAKLFDADGDGRLNTMEHAAAMKALESNFEENFKFGVEASGPSGQRIV